MSNINFVPIPEPAIPTWPEYIKMIMPGEPASGGPGSPENTQADQLAERTQWLKREFARMWQYLLNLDPNIPKPPVEIPSGATINGIENVTSINGVPMPLVLFGEEPVYLEVT